MDDRWELDNTGRGVFTEIEPDVAGYFPEMHILTEKSFVHGSERAVFIGLRDDGQSSYVHLSADDAEAMATVLMYLADQWRKENPDAAT